MGNQIIAWRGIALMVPEAWYLTGFGGDDRSGSVRIEGGDAEVRHRARGLELRWLQVKRAQTSQLLDERLKALLSSIERAARKKRLAVRTLLFNSPVLHGSAPFGSFFLRCFWHSYPPRYRLGFLRASCV